MITALSRRQLLGTRPCVRTFPQQNEYNYNKTRENNEQKSKQSLEVIKIPNDKQSLEKTKFEKITRARKLKAETCDTSVVCSQLLINRMHNSI